ncbi:MAG TPA: prenyltransferase/squalene oxidase repeat-containing protein [Candidatus Elarobacter sp.]
MRTVDQAIVRAVAFLRRRQLPYGEFTTLLGADRQLSNPVFDTSPFITSLVLYGLTHVDRALAGDMVAKAAAFLLSQMEFGGVWRYWSSRQHKHCRLPPDTDDTACASYALKSLGYSVPDNRWAFHGNRDSAGRFKTWMFVTRRNCLNLRFGFSRSVGFCQARLRTRTIVAPKSEDPRFVVMHIDCDDVDPVVNANAVLCLGEGPDTLAAIEFIIDTVVNASGRSLYYEDPLALYNAVARAFRHSAPRLSVVGKHIVARIVELGAALESFNPMQAAMAASALLTFDPVSAVVPKLLDVVLETQRGDGGWNAYAYYTTNGSEELTTAFCLEVLARCREHGVQPNRAASRSAT